MNTKIWADQMLKDVNENSDCSNDWGKSSFPDTVGNPEEARIVKRNCMMGEYYRKIKEKEDEDWDRAISKKTPPQYLVANLFLEDGRGFEIMKVKVRDVEDIDKEKEQLLSYICEQLQEDFYIIRTPECIAVPKKIINEIVIEARDE